MTYKILPTDGTDCVDVNTSLSDAKTVAQDVANDLGCDVEVFEGLTLVAKIGATKTLTYSLRLESGDDVEIEADSIEEAEEAAVDRLQEEAEAYLDDDDEEALDATATGWLHTIDGDVVVDAKHLSVTAEREVES